MLAGQVSKVYDGESEEQSAEMSPAAQLKPLFGAVERRHLRLRTFLL